MQFGFRYFIEEFGSQLIRVKIIDDDMRQEAALKVHLVESNLKVMFPDVLRDTNDVREWTLE